MTVVDDVSERSLTTVFQPIVQLDTGAVFGAEALSRDSAGDLAMTSLFETARSPRALTELDRRCRVQALQAWLAADVPAGCALFLNVEPESMRVPLSGPEQDLLGRLITRGTTVVLEVTERQILGFPRGLIRFREEIREAGMLIAIDDLGSDPASLAVLPLLRPDVMKLDTRLMRTVPDRTTAQVVNAVLAESERSGAIVLAEGVETEDDLAFALSAGAGLGQGWLFGRPTSSLPPVSARTAPIRGAPAPARTDEPTGSTPRTPWDLAAGRSNLLRAQTPLLAAISRYVEAHSAVDPDATIVLAAFQHRDPRRLEHPRPLPGLRGAGLLRRDARGRDGTDPGTVGPGPCPGARRPDGRRMGPRSALATHRDGAHRPRGPPEQPGNGAGVRLSADVRPGPGRRGRRGRRHDVPPLRLIPGQSDHPGNTTRSAAVATVEHGRTDAAVLRGDPGSHREVAGPQGGDEVTAA